MSLTTLIILVVTGIGGIALILHLIGLSKQRVFDGPEDATDRWLREFPSDDVVGVTVSHRGTAALIQTRRGIGLVWAMGADTAARRLDHYDVEEDGTGIRVTFHDFTAPQVHIALDYAERQHWQNLMQP